MELRERIAALFAVARRAGAEGKPGDPDDFAALVLAIPELAEALMVYRAPNDYAVTPDGKAWIHRSHICQLD